MGRRPALNRKYGKCRFCGRVTWLIKTIRNADKDIRRTVYWPCVICRERMLLEWNEIRVNAIR
jgi:hypothetical protein